jgi:3',5'-cyclic AMP phosphodiesterase CpdA
VQVSDTHLSEERGYFNDNFDIFCAEMAADPPDLIVHTGDISLDGAAGDSDLVYGVNELKRLPGDVLTLAGNHDIGEAPKFSRLDQPLDDTRSARWAGIAGDRWWSRTVGDGWLIVGLDTALMASGLADEARQIAFFRDTLAAHKGGRKLIFMHMPPYLNDPDDTKFSALAIPHPARADFLDACTAHGVRAIACGHVHVYRTLTHRGMDVVWAPPTSFVNIAAQLKRGYNFPRAGYLEWMLDGDAISHRLVEPALMITQDVGRWNADHGSTTHMPPFPARRRPA